MGVYHVNLLNHTLNLYNINHSLFIDEILAASLAYGWYPDQHSENGLNEVVLFAIGHNDNMTFGLVRFTKGRMMLENCWAIPYLGSRDMQLWFVEKFLELAQNDFEEIDRDEIMKNGYLRMSLFKELKESFSTLGCIDCEEVNAQSENVVEDETVVVEMNYKDFDEHASELFSDKLGEVVIKIRNVSNDIRMIG